MATHSSVLAWRIPGTGEPGGLPSMGSHWVVHDWSDLAVVAVQTKLKTITKKLLTLVFNYPACLYVCQCMWYHFPGGSEGKESACNARDLDLILRLGRSPGEGNGNHSNIPAWRIPWIEEPNGLQSWDHSWTWLSKYHTHTCDITDTILLLQTSYFL